MSVAVACHTRKPRIVILNANMAAVCGVRAFSHVFVGALMSVKLCIPFRTIFICIDFDRVCVVKIYGMNTFDETKKRYQYF